MFINYEIYHLGSMLWSITCASMLWMALNLYKMPVRYILSSVWVRLSIFSPLSIIQYVGLYVFSLPISVLMIERKYIHCLIIIIKTEVWTIIHCLGLGHETMVSAVCLSIFVFFIIVLTGKQYIPILIDPMCALLAVYRPGKNGSSQSHMLDTYCEDYS